ncbi:MAG: DUF1501 domain-containing protein [Planctomycetes bacterium]|nr:DUF1501 domain-containing protein [Planctomycetota bacterium]
MTPRPLDRRGFLKQGILGVSIAGTFPAFLAKTAAWAQGSAAGDDRVLVVLQLSGGNDGLSTLVPYSDPAYGRARSTIRVDEGAVLKIDDRVGLHPNLKEFKGLFDEGSMAIVQGVSYPNPSRSHFESMDVWHAADRSGPRRGSGWLGRAIDSTCGNATTPLSAVNLGGSVPLALQGERTKPVAFQNPGSYQWRGGRGEREAFARLNALPAEMEPEMKGPGAVRPLDFLRRVASDASASSEAIRKATQAYAPKAPYPPGNRLAEDLRLVAAMIAAGLPTRVYYASLGGFDTHANQRGTHDNLMRVFSTGVAAFLKDLAAQGLAGRVLVLAFSEFGRRVKENASRGTDHGVAAPMFLFGDGVLGGIHGKHPSLTELDSGDLVMTTDFRRVYATVLDGWLGAPSEKVLGERFEPLPLLGAKEKVRAF